MLADAVARPVHKDRTAKSDPSPIRDAHDSQPTRSAARPQAAKTSGGRAATSDAALDEPRRSNPIRDAARSADALHDAPPKRAARSAGSEPAARVPDEVKRAVQAAGGIVRGVATAGSGPAQSIARALKVGRVPGAAIINGAFAAHDTIREFQRSGLSQDTVRTAAGGIGGVAGAFKGGAIGATIGTAVGGPVGAVIGGAAGALIGGFVGSKVGQGVVDAAYGAARAVSDFASDVADDVADAAEEVADTVSDAADTVGDAVGSAADAVGDAVDSITPW